jgi:hypothetical protein
MTPTDVDAPHSPGKVAMSSEIPYTSIGDGPMTDHTAPEMIWADPSVFPEDAPDWTCGDWTDSDLGAGSRAVLYIRADLHRPSGRDHEMTDNAPDRIWTWEYDPGHPEKRAGEWYTLDVGLDGDEVEYIRADIRRAHTEAAVRRALVAAAKAAGDAAVDALVRQTPAASHLLIQVTRMNVASQVLALDHAQFIGGGE